jgi:hypothetical protein
MDDTGVSGDVNLGDVNLGDLDTGDKKSNVTMIIIIVVIVVIVVVLISSIIGSVVFFSSKSTTNTTTKLPQITTSAPITAPTRPPITAPPADTLITKFQPNTNDNLAWENMPDSDGKKLNKLGYTLTCSRPWYAYYQIGCTVNDKTVYSKKIGPVYKDNWQGPNIRIAPDGQDNYCSQIKGTLSVLRQRPNDKSMIDITPYLMNDDRTGVYNGRDPVFTDLYKIDCSSN